MVDDANALTLADEVFDLLPPPTQEITHVDTQEVTLVDTQEATQEQIPQGDDLALPPLPMHALTAPNSQDATVADEENSQTLLDGMFNRPADLT
jgi:hypothetical protein